MNSVVFCWAKSDCLDVTPGNWRTFYNRQANLQQVKFLMAAKKKLVINF